MKQTQNLHQLKTAIIDDDLLACKSLARRLESLLDQNVEIAYWTNPKKALSIIPDYNPEIIFLDVQMPYLSGFEVLSKLKENGFKGRVIFTTAYDQYVLDALRAEAFDYLLKPIDADEFQEVIVRFRSKENEISTDLAALISKGLTPREMDIVSLIFKGKSSKEIGEQLFISKATVDKHRSNILQKTGCKNTTELFTLL